MHISGNVEHVHMLCVYRDVQHAHTAIGKHSHTVISVQPYDRFLTQKNCGLRVRPLVRPITVVLCCTLPHSACSVHEYHICHQDGS